MPQDAQVFDFFFWWSVITTVFSVIFLLLSVWQYFEANKQKKEIMLKLKYGCSSQMV